MGSTCCKDDTIDIRRPINIPKQTRRPVYTPVISQRQLEREAAQMREYERIKQNHIAGINKQLQEEEDRRNNYIDSTNYEDQRIQAKNKKIEDAKQSAFMAKTYERDMPIDGAHNSLLRPPELTEYEGAFGSWSWN